MSDDRHAEPDPSQGPTGASAGGPAVPVSNWNLPNALTTLRIVLVPLFGWLLLIHDGEDPSWRVWAFVVFTLAILTDRIDGEIARRRNLVTDFGKLMDPIADKALTGMGFVGLSIIGELWWWVTIVVLGREWGITLMRFLIIKYGVMPASRGGKIKTTLQAVALCGMILPLHDLDGTWGTIGEALWWVAAIVMAAAVVVTVVTGLDYVREALKLRREGQAASRPAEVAMTAYDDLAASCLRALESRHQTLAAAESLTAGLVTATLATVPGASNVLRGGLTAYASDIKVDVLGVDADLLAEHGVYSTVSAEQMAVRVRTMLHADWGVSTTGVAGPEPDDGHPVGEVYVAVSGPGDVVVCRALTLTGDRQQIRVATVVGVLDLLRERLS